MKQGSKLNGKVPQHEFIPDSRLEPVWDRLHKEFKGKLPEDTQFATTVQPAQWVDRNGLEVIQPETILFWAVATNPQPRWKGKLIKQYGTMRMEDWAETEKEKWRFAGLPDPLYTIFKALSIKLIETYTNFKEMN